jgi:hypothetical protein
MITVKISTNAEGAANAFAGMADRMREAYRASISDIADAIALESQRLVPVGKSRKGYTGGTLRDSLNIARFGDYEVVGYHTPYARIVHDGLKAPMTVQVPPHMRLQAWAWGKPIAPRIVRVRAHTATFKPRAGNPYLADAVAEVEPRIEDMVVARIEDAKAKYAAETGASTLEVG